MHDQERCNTPQKGTVIVFTRYPESGKSKTRLIGALGPDKAARLQFHMLRNVLQRAERVCGRGNVRICFDGGTVSGFKALLGSGWVFSPQKKGGPGQKMCLAFHAAEKENPGPLVLIGSDCPDVSPELLRQAFSVLATKDVVLGPAVDGGFYLVGIHSRLGSCRLDPIMADVDWGTARVLKQVVQRVQEAGLSCGFTAELRDVDRPEDLRGDVTALLDPACSRISVIVPALNEETCLADTLYSIRRGDHVQVILADGGSTDRTVRIARELGAEIVNSGGGRSRQMNAGAKRAKGEILVFVHADTKMPFLYDWYVRRAVHGEHHVGGSFRFSLDPPFSGSTWLARMVDMRSRLLRMPYGDQALFMEKEAFRSIGGYEPVPLLEDVKLVSRMKKTGRVAILPVSVKTSSRRWIEKGIIRNTLLNQIIMYGYYLGIPINTLASLYKK